MVSPGVINPVECEHWEANSRISGEQKAMFLRHLGVHYSFE